MTIQNPNHKIIAKAIRVEIDKEKDNVYLVFKIIDSNFKKRIRANWLEDTELEIVDKTLVEKNA